MELCLVAREVSSGDTAMGVKKRSEEMTDPTLQFPLVRQILPGHPLHRAIRPVAGAVAWPDWGTRRLVGLKLPGQSPTQARGPGLACGRKLYPQP